MKKIFLGAFFLLLAYGVLLLIPNNYQMAFGYGTVSAPSCDKEEPAKVVLYEPGHYLLPKATGVGEVRLNWLKASRATKYTLGFGLTPGNYIYGLPDVGDTDHFIVQYLTPGRKYYFVVRGVNDCKPGPWSIEWPVLVGGQRILVKQPSTGGYITPTTVPTTFIPSQEVLPTTPTLTPSVPSFEQPTTSPATPTLPPISQPSPPLSLWQRILRLFGINR